MKDTSPHYVAGRRDILRGAALLAAAPLLAGGLPDMARADGKQKAMPGKNDALDLPLMTHLRTLGTGKAAMTISALGFWRHGRHIQIAALPRTKNPSSAYCTRPWSTVSPCSTRPRYTAP